MGRWNTTRYNRCCSINWRPSCSPVWFWGICLVSKLQQSISSRLKELWMDNGEDEVDCVLEVFGLVEPSVYRRNILSRILQTAGRIYGKIWSLGLTVNCSESRKGGGLTWWPCACHPGEKTAEPGLQRNRLVAVKLFPSVILQHAGDPMAVVLVVLNFFWMCMAAWKASDYSRNFRNNVMITSRW